MKFVIYADPHWSSYSSIVRGRGYKYSDRLEKLISSINYVEAVAEETDADGIICLGDFFDKEFLNSEEISALSEVKFSKTVPHYFLCGNHEMGRGDGTFSSSFIMKLCENTTVFSEPTSVVIGDTDFFFLPYILPKKLKPLEDYIGGNTAKHRVIFSHNDLSGVQYGSFLSDEGLDIHDIESHCDLFINGHLHNGYEITPRVINLGNLVGQNFSEDAMIYDHNIMVLTQDGDYFDWEYIENPYSFNFYKLDFTTGRVEDAKKRLDCLKENSVVSVKILDSQTELIDLIKNTKNISYNRIVVEQSNTEKEPVKVEELQSCDHIKMFMDYVKSVCDNSPLLESELSKITR